MSIVWVCCHSIQKDIFYYRKRFSNRQYKSITNAYASLNDIFKRASDPGIADRYITFFHIPDRLKSSTKMAF